MKGTTELLVEAHRILDEIPNISLTAMFIEGARYIELGSKSHVAEVVKCEQVNKSIKTAWQIKNNERQNEILKTIRTNTMKYYPELIVDTPGPLSTLEIKLTKEEFENSDEELRQFAEDLLEKIKINPNYLNMGNPYSPHIQNILECPESAFREELLSENPTITTVPRCNHEPGPFAKELFIQNIRGYNCVKCGQWIKCQND